MREHHLQVSRSARYFVLGPDGPGVAEIWFVLHGYGQLAAPFLKSFGPLDDGTRLLVAPEALSRFYVSRTGDRQIGASWMTREDRLTEIADYVRYLDTVHADVVARVPTPGAPTHVLGFSQGTATACRWVALGGVGAARLILWAGEVPPDLDLAAARERLGRVQIILVVGRRDTYITEKIVAREENRLREHGIPCRVVWFEGGHELDADVLRDVARS